MSYRYKSYARQRYSSAPDAAVRHMRERRELSSKVYGLDNEIIEKLFKLSPSRLEEFFNIFERTYSTKSGQYAREAWPFWASKRRGISGLNAQRFISLAPTIFSFEDRYELIKKLYEKTRGRESHSLTLVIGHAEGAIGDVEQLFYRLCLKPSEHVLPESVSQFAMWVSHQDAVMARKLTAAIETEESLMIVKVARLELDRLVTALRSFNQNISGTHYINLPYGSISLHVRKPTVFEKIGKLFA